MSIILYKKQVTKDCLLYDSIYIKIKKPERPKTLVKKASTVAV